MKAGQRIVVIPGDGIGTEITVGLHACVGDRLLEDRKRAETVALNLAATMMLEQLDLEEQALRVKRVVRGAIETHDRCTPDLGGDGTTQSFATAIIEKLD